MTMMMFIPKGHKTTKWWAIKLGLGKNNGFSVLFNLVALVLIIGLRLD
jgi:hypothetical protein